MRWSAQLALLLLLPALSLAQAPTTTHAVTNSGSNTTRPTAASSDEHAEFKPLPRRTWRIIAQTFAGAGSSVVGAAAAVPAALGALALTHRDEEQEGITSRQFHVAAFSGIGALVLTLPLMTGSVVYGVGRGFKARGTFRATFLSAAGGTAGGMALGALVVLPALGGGEGGEGDGLDNYLFATVIAVPILGFAGCLVGSIWGYDYSSRSADTRAAQRARISLPVVTMDVHHGAATLLVRGTF